MSAFVVSKPHIDFLATAAHELGMHMDEHGDLLSQTKLGQIWWDENERSVAYRYNDETITAERYTYRRNTAGMDVKSAKWLCQVLKAIACLEYQSCETDDWEKTTACKLLMDLRSRTIAHLTHNLHRDLAWEIR